MHGDLFSSKTLHVCFFKRNLLLCNHSTAIRLRRFVDEDQDVIWGLIPNLTEGLTECALGFGGETAQGSQVQGPWP